MNKDADKPVKTTESVVERKTFYRRASRIVVRNNGKVFLQHDSDPAIGMFWWATPGGGLDGEDSFENAAVRELFEETGMQISESQLIGPVAHRVVTHGFSNKILIQEEYFFVVDVDYFEPDISGFTPIEVETIKGWKWFTAAELAQTPDVCPAQLSDIVTAKPGDFVEWGEVEESTVPV